MLEILKFVLGDPFTFMGTLILIFAVGAMLEVIVDKIFRK